MEGGCEMPLDYRRQRVWAQNAPFCMEVQATSPIFHSFWFILRAGQMTKGALAHDGLQRISDRSKIASGAYRAVGLPPLSPAPKSLGGEKERSSRSRVVFFEASAKDSQYPRSGQFGAHESGGAESHVA